MCFSDFSKEPLSTGTVIHFPDPDKYNGVRGIGFGRVVSNGFLMDSFNLKPSELPLDSVWSLF